MKEIVKRLQDGRQIKLAKRILESNGYKVNSQRRSSTGFKILGWASEHKERYEATGIEYYGYITVSVLGMGEFQISVRVSSHNTVSDISLDGSPWEFIKKDYRKHPEHAKWLQKNVELLAKELR